MNESADTIISNYKNKNLIIQNYIRKLEIAKHQKIPINLIKFIFKYIQFIDNNANIISH